VRLEPAFVNGADPSLFLGSARKMKIFLARLPPAIQRILTTADILKLARNSAAHKAVDTAAFIAAWDFAVAQQQQEQGGLEQLYRATLTQNLQELELVLTALKQLWIGILTRPREQLPPPVSAELREMAQHDPERELDPASIASLAVRRVPLMRDPLTVPILWRGGMLPWLNLNPREERTRARELLLEAASLEVVNASQVVLDDARIQERIIWMPAEMHANRKVRFSPRYLHADGSVKLQPVDASAEPFFYDLKGVGLTGVGSFRRSQSPNVTPGYLQLDEGLASWRGALHAEQHKLRGSRFVGLVMAPYHAPQTPDTAAADGYWRPVVKLVELHAGRRMDYRFSHIVGAPVDRPDAVVSYLRAAAEDAAAYGGQPMLTEPPTELVQAMLTHQGAVLRRDLTAGYEPRRSLHNLTPDGFRIDHQTARLSEEVTDDNDATVQLLLELESLVPPLAALKLVDPAFEYSTLPRQIEEGKRRTVGSDKASLFDQLAPL